MDFSNFSMNDAVSLNDTTITTAGATPPTVFAPTAAVLVALLAAQSVAATMALDLTPDRSYTAALTSVTLQKDLAEALLDFHRRLADSQTDLPDAAARVLRENMWHLYE